MLLSDKVSKDILWISSVPFLIIKANIIPKNISLQKQQLRFNYTENKLSKNYTISLNEVFEQPKKTVPDAVFDRITHNPLLQSIQTNHWESQAVFNSAALYLDGRVHLIYRAIGDSGLSNFGYASSIDGINIDRRLATPIYVDNISTEPEKNDSQSSVQDYQSGINWGGYEDPRLTKIEDTIYMTYTAFD